jgi:hypothetical protein
VVHAVSAAFSNSDMAWKAVDGSCPGHFFLSKADSSGRLPEKHGGRKRSVSLREILNGIFYVLFDRMPMAAFAGGPASGDHSASLLDAMGLGRHIGTHPSCALCGGRRQGER